MLPPDTLSPQSRAYLSIDEMKRLATTTGWQDTPDTRNAVESPLGGEDRTVVGDETRLCEAGARHRAHVHCASAAPTMSSTPVNSAREPPRWLSSSAESPRAHAPRPLPPSSRSREIRKDRRYALRPRPAARSVPDPHPPGAPREACASVSFGPRPEHPSVLRLEGAKPLHRFGRRSPIA